MKKLLALLTALCLMLPLLPAMAETGEIVPEPNTLVAKINGEMVTLYLNFATQTYAQFNARDENGRLLHSIHLSIRTNTKPGTYEGFSTSNVYEMWYNTDYEYDIFGDAKDSRQYIGGDYARANIIGGNQASAQAMRNNKGEIVLRLDKATGYRFQGVFSAKLHDIKKDEFIPIQGKFDYTIGESYETPAPQPGDQGVSLDDIDF